VSIIAGDDKSADNADPSDTGKILAAEIVKYTDNVGLTCSAQGKLREHHRCAEKYNYEKVNEQETSSSAFICPSREFPDVAETYS
jgi:hypothetical protein